MARSGLSTGRQDPIPVSGRVDHQGNLTDYRQPDVCQIAEEGNVGVFERDWADLDCTFDTPTVDLTFGVDRLEPADDLRLFEQWNLVHHRYGQTQRGVVAGVEVSWQSRTIRQYDMRAGYPLHVLSSRSSW